MTGPEVPVLVDELLIPHPDGAIKVPLDERVTVFAGLDASARERFARLVVDALTGDGAAAARLTDELGQSRHTSQVTPPPESLARRMVVGPGDLGLDLGAPDPLLEAERTATTMAFRQLEGELAAIEAGAAEADRLRAELETAPWLRAFDDHPLSGGRDERLDAAEGVIDHLLTRRRAAEQLLRATALAVRSTDLRRGPVDGEAHDAGTGLLDAVAAMRRLEARRQEIEVLTPPGTALAEALAAEASEVRASLRRAATELQAARRSAIEEVEHCDRSLGALADELGLEVDDEGPAAALKRALDARADAAAGDEALDPETARLLARRQAMLRARIAELPTDEDVRVARRRVASTAAHLARLGGPTTPPPVERIRNILLARAAALRPDGIDAAVPLVLDDPLVRLDPTTRCDLLDVVARISDRTQVVMLTGDPVVATWARRRAERGEVRLFDLALVPTG